MTHIKRRVKGISNIRRIPVTGKIFLGIKKKAAKKNNQGEDVFYPSETDYFVCPPEVEILGKNGTSINILSLFFITPWIGEGLELYSQPFFQQP